MRLSGPGSLISIVLLRGLWACIGAATFQRGDFHYFPLQVRLGHAFMQLSHGPMLLALHVNAHGALVRGAACRSQHTTRSHNNLEPHWSEPGQPGQEWRQALVSPDTGPISLTSDCPIVQDTTSARQDRSYRHIMQASDRALLLQTSQTGVQHQRTLAKSAAGVRDTRSPAPSV